MTTASLMTCQLSRLHLIHFMIAVLQFQQKLRHSGPSLSPRDATIFLKVCRMLFAGGRQSGFSLSIGEMMSMSSGIQCPVNWSQKVSITSSLHVFFRLTNLTRT